MNSSRLWPVAGALVVLIAGSIAIEVGARLRDPEAIRISISDHAQEVSDDASEELGEGADDVLGGEHELARQYAKRHDFKQALALYERLLVENPDAPGLEAEYAHWLLRSGDAASARQHLLHALAARPDDAPMLLELGFLEQRLGDAKAADAAFRRALAARPNHSGSRMALGEALRKAGHLSEAIEILGPAASNGSNEERARGLTLLGRCYMAAGERARARKLVEEAVERAPAFVNTWLRAAYALLESADAADLDAALQYALGAIKLAPELALAHRLVGRIHDERGAHEDALRAYRQSLDFDPGSVKTRRRVFRLALDSDNLKEATRQALALVKDEPTNAEHRFLLGLVEARSDHADQALAHYAEAIALNGDHYPEAWFNIGIVHSKLGDSVEAIRAYERALAEAPRYAAAWNNLGRVQLSEGDVADAEQSFKTALEVDPQYGLAWHNLGRLFFKQERFSEAQRAYGKAVALRPRDRGIVLKYAIAQRRAGNLDDAVETYRKLLAAHPRYVKGWFNLGVALVARGDLEGARAAYQKAIEYEPAHPGAHKNLGYLETRLGHPEQAVAHLSEALDHFPTDEDTRLKLAETHLLAADARRCRTEVQRVLQQNPENSSAHAMLARCAQ